MNAHLVAVLIIVAVTAAVYLLGWHSHGLYADRQADRAEDASRHRHAVGDPQETTLLQLPRAGRLPLNNLPATGPSGRWLESEPAGSITFVHADTTGSHHGGGGAGWSGVVVSLSPVPPPAASPWVFAGGWDQGPSGSAEYELPTQTAEQPAPVTGEPPIGTGEIMAITDRVDAWIADMAAQGNYDRHTIQAGE